MSAFSEYCRQLLLESGSNVYRIAKQADLDRTSIQRMITGKRIPGIQFVEKFCSYLHLSSNEKQKLLELYKIEKIGIELYQNRQYIKTMIECMNQSNYCKEFGTYKSNVITKTVSGTDYYAESYAETIQLLESIFYKELSSNSQSVFFTNIPVSYNAFFILLEKISNETDSTFELHHLFILNKAPSIFSKSNYNLEILHKVLPLVIKFSTQYFPRYIYSKATSSDDHYYIYPYYLITNNCVLCISADFKSSVLYLSSSIITHYQSEFNHLNTLSIPLIKQQRFHNDYLLHISNTIMTYGKPSHILSDGFFPLLYSQYNLRPFHSINKTDATNLRNIMGDSKMKCMHFFPSSSYKKCFLEKTTSFPLTNILTNSAHTEIENYLLKEEFHFPSRLTVLLYNSQSLIFLFSQESKKESISICIEESDLCHSFLDFFDSLPESGLCYSVDETKDILSSTFNENTP